MGRGTEVRAPLPAPKAPPRRARPRRSSPRAGGPAGAATDPAGGRQKLTWKTPNCTLPPAAVKYYRDWATDDGLVTLMTGTSGRVMASDVLEHMHLFGGLRAFECACPKAFTQLRNQVTPVVGYTAFEWLYEHDAEILPLVQNSARLQKYASDLGAWYEATTGVTMTAGAQVAYQFAEDNAFDYLSAVDGFAKGGAGVLLGWQAIYHDVKAAALFIDEETNAAQLDADQRAAALAERKQRGLANVGTTVATKENVFSGDDISLEELAVPEDGLEDWNLAVAWARLMTHAAAVVEIEDRYYLYTINKNLDYDDVWESDTFEEHRSALVPVGALRTQALVTSDGYVLTLDGQRFFGGHQSKTASQQLLADLQIAEEHSAGADSLTLVRQIALDMLMLRLADAESGLKEARNRIHPSWGMITREEGEALQDRTEELRRHMLQAAQLAFDAADPPTDDEREAMEDELAEIGRLSADDPVAASMVKNSSGEDARTRPTDKDFKNRLAGMMPGDALQLALDDIETKLGNIDKTRRHFYGHPDAVLDVDELVDAARTQLPDSAQPSIDWELFMRTAGQIGDFYRGVVKEALLFGAGAVTGTSWVGMLIWGVQAARGVQGVKEGFEQAELLEAMSNLDLSRELQLATPEEAASAERWAWIGLGLTVVDGAMFVRSAAHTLRLAVTMKSPQVRMAVEESGRTLRDLAGDAGMSERRLVTELAVARGADRAELLDKLRKAKDAVAAAAAARMAKQAVRRRISEALAEVGVAWKNAAGRVGSIGVDYELFKSLVKLAYRFYEGGALTVREFITEVRLHRLFKDSEIKELQAAGILDDAFHEAEAMWKLGEFVDVRAGWKAVKGGGRTGCEMAAKQIQELVGGEVRTITSRLGPNHELGAFDGMNHKWKYHVAVIDNGRVYDLATGSNGVSIEDYKRMWTAPDDIDFGF